MGPRLPSRRHVVELMTRDPMSPSRREADSSKGHPHSRLLLLTGIGCCCSLATDNLRLKMSFESLLNCSISSILHGSMLLSILSLDFIDRHEGIRIKLNVLYFLNSPFFKLRNV